ncbi:pyridoxal 5'-phosphate synthase glutaminase subunit PdxT [Clostridium omnivorum]|uniref:Pyridoxal 5'-phosphate synthase subunit PdxT n=1 Tax=Clostridium omnivorum TaxID=1604902 RepID=A0ABQ5N4B1_9CLOT|nr:pyridoxal 5'-phosphate synthase glutaminase subunit PdxT [Clostridium sp. E14]GLC29964.1 pyridoxal 5'-phosphate synthase subunit PdxT [Clostridium sp. E14]
MRIGVLALQGGVIEHIKHLKALDVEVVEVKNAEQLKTLQGIILPGGESTTMGKLLRERGMIEELRESILMGMPTYGTCAGMILLAKEIEGERESYLGLMNIKVKRNAYGSQLDSFVTNEVIGQVSNKEIPLVFIRAPYIMSTGNEVNIIHKVNDNIVAAREDNILVTSFHPELTNNLDFHRYFISMCANY